MQDKHQTPVLFDNFLPTPQLALSFHSRIDTQFHHQKNSNVIISIPSVWNKPSLTSVVDSAKKSSTTLAALHTQR
ncbi:hypothetical protein JTE90_022251 [Oedothorax gibbosus]|uniref:Uncharacterized protein n=1 Tax=Oedothorax gibbosus TaxID=931172 RepID=A0AAV6VVE4_9ARAC|nr:hypothetical protein JTE90_022251 [Oedothorax gibbosus]